MFSLGKEGVKGLEMYKYHFVAIGMFAAWANLTLMCRTLPQTGNYIEMLVKVSGSFAQFLGTFSSLLVGFGVSLAVLIPTTPIFQQEIPHVLGKVRLPGVFLPAAKKTKVPKTQTQGF